MKTNVARSVVAVAAVAAAVLLVALAAGRSSATGPAAGGAAAGGPANGRDVLRAEKIDGALPTDPGDPAWQAATEYAIPLVSQFSVAPGSPKLARLQIRVRALYNDGDFALLVVVPDATENDEVTAAGRFGDAVAVGFPFEYGQGVPLPYIGMGNEGRAVNIWQWKAAWQTDLAAGYRGVAQAYPNRVPLVGPIRYRAGEQAGSPLSQTSHKSPVENLVAEGFGTLTSTPSARLAGKGLYGEGGWRVVLTRPLKPRGVGVRIRPEAGPLPITFAVWDGEAGERDGMKGLTRWRFLAFSEQEEAAGAALASGDVVAGADLARGKELLVTLGCPQCHKLPGVPAGGKVGPDLSHAGAIHRPEYLLESIIKPNAVVVKAPGYFDATTGLSTMPSFYNMREDEDDPNSKLLVTDEDFRDMAAYLWSLQ